MNEENVKTTESTVVLSLPTTLGTINNGVRDKDRALGGIDYHPAAMVTTQTEVRSESSKRNDQDTLSTDSKQSKTLDVTSIDAALASCIYTAGGV